jgi:hypothetical protein
MIQNSNETFQVGEQCNVELCRDLETFGLIEPDVDDSLDIDLTFE